jgi:hypothetical protein
VGTILDWPKLAQHTRSLLGLLEQYRVERWYAFSSHPARDPWAAIPNATYLLDEANQPTPLLPVWLGTQPVAAAVPPT